MRFTSKALAVAVAASAAVFPATAVAGNERPAQAVHHHVHAVGQISSEEFLTAAAQSNRFEIVTGQLAQQRAQSQAIKDLGAMFVVDHTRLLQQGAAVADKLGIKVPEGLSPRQQAIVDRLAKLSGRDFDAAWLAAQLDAHKQALVLTLRAAIRGEDPDVRTLAQGALPVITHHLGELLDLAASGDRDDNKHHDGDDNGKHDDHGSKDHDHNGRDGDSRHGKGHDTRHHAHHR